MSAPICLSRTRAAIELGDERLEELRGRFVASDSLQLAGLLGPDLCELARADLEHASFEPASYESVGSNRVMVAGRLLDALGFVLNDRSLFTAIERITGCEHIGEFVGRVYRLRPDEGQLDQWHSDAFDGRMVGLSINLSDEPFEGGILEIRETEGAIRASLANVGLGDALLFRIGDDLQHRLTPLTGTRPKTSYAGWFRACADYEETFRLARQARKTSQ